MNAPRLFANSPAAVTEARRYVVGQLVGVPRAITDEIAVMVSELATNCVRHTDTEFSVSLEATPRRILVEVTDRGAGHPARREPRASEPTGRGLRIVQELADSFGVRQAPEPPGKTVWFVVDLDRRASARAADDPEARDVRRV